MQFLYVTTKIQSSDSLSYIGLCFQLNVLNDTEISYKEHWICSSFNQRGSALMISMRIILSSKKIKVPESIILEPRWSSKAFHLPSCSYTENPWNYEPEEVQIHTIPDN